MCREREKSYEWGDTLEFLLNLISIDKTMHICANEQRCFSFLFKLPWFPFLLMGRKAYSSNVVSYKKTDELEHGDVRVTYKNTQVVHKNVRQRTTTHRLHTTTYEWRTDYTQGRTSDVHVTHKTYEWRTDVEMKAAHLLCLFFPSTQFSDHINKFLHASI